MEAATKKDRFVAKPKSGHLFRAQRMAASRPLCRAWCPVAYGPMRTLMDRTAKVFFEPDSAIVILCCVRSQREECGMSEKVRASAQRFNRPFVYVAA